MTEPVRVMAVDLGATSVRVTAVDLSSNQPSVEIVHRWPHGPVAASDGSLRWDWARIVREITVGLTRGIETGPVASIGVDGWGVDYGLVDGDGKLVSSPYSYRDSRTDQWRVTAEKIGIQRLYELTGIQLLAINTLFQLAAHDRGELVRAERLLMLPDLLVNALTGFVGAERSNASTTGLIDARTGQWSSSMIDAIGVPASLFPELQAAGLRAGGWRGIPVHLVGSHDTASAFLGMPGGGEPGTVFVSTGTWVIVGTEQPTPHLSRAAFESNFSNEAGAMGGVRLLKNVPGFWLLEQCRTGWGEVSVGQLIEAASSIDEPVPTFDPCDERFLHPPDMEREIRAAAGLSGEAPRAVIVRVILESIAAGIASVVDELRTLTEPEPNQVALVGGGAHVRLLHQLIGQRTNLPVIAGDPEATALGNAIVQGVALGHFAAVADGRRWLEPTGRAVWPA